MIRYIITSHAGASGVYLSKPGQWGNLPHTSDAAAVKAAVKDAAGAPHAIERQFVRRKGK